MGGREHEVNVTRDLVRVLNIGQTAVPHDRDLGRREGEPRLYAGLRDGRERLTALPLHYGHREVDMLFTLAVILLILWLLGVVGTYTIGAVVHVLLVAALVLFVIGLLSGRRTVV